MKTAIPMKVELGTVIHGTLRPEDLIPTFLEELKKYTDEIPQFENGDCVQEYIIELIDALNEHSPPYCYFGTHISDGSDFGFWVDFDSIEMDTTDAKIRSQCTLYTVHSSTEPWPTGRIESDYIIDINDHGNMTLYDTDDNVIWAIV